MVTKTDGAWDPSSTPGTLPSLLNSLSKWDACSFFKVKHSGVTE